MGRAVFRPLAPKFDEIRPSDRIDKRGTGMSDRVDSLPNLDERMDDVRAVMDAADSKRAAVYGLSEGGSLATLFAATYPERCQALVLCGAFAKFSSWFPTAERLDAFYEYVESKWGTGANITTWAASRKDDPAFRAWWARRERLGASPAAVIALMRMNSLIDISGIFTVRSCTHSRDSPDERSDRKHRGRADSWHEKYRTPVCSSFQAIRICRSSATMSTTITDQIAEFLTGAKPIPHGDRTLATVVLTDIVELDQTCRGDGRPALA